jgi:hypothetical protein
MPVKLALSARDVVKAKIRLVVVAADMRNLLLCAKKYQSLQKKHVKSGLVWTCLDLDWFKSGLSLDFVETVEG